MISKAELEDKIGVLEFDLDEAKKNIIELEADNTRLANEDSAELSNLKEFVWAYDEAAEYLLDALRGSSKAHALVAIGRMEQILRENPDA